jgi:hypothetical protein
MAQNYYLYEKLAEAHRQDLLREADQQRLVAGLSQDLRSGVQLAIGTRRMLALALVLVMPFVVSSGVAWDNHPQAFVQHMVAWYSHPQAFVQHLVAWDNHPQALVQRLVA